MRTEYDLEAARISQSHWCIDAARSLSVARQLNSHAQLMKPSAFGCEFFVLAEEYC